MNFKAAAHVVSVLLVITGFCILSAAPVSWLMGDPARDVELFILCALIPICAGVLSAYYTRPRQGKLKLGIREGFGIVTFTWLAAGIFGALPFVLIADFHWYDAFFETMSGFTTTGASVIEKNLVLSSGKILNCGLEGISRGLIYWRSLTHWLGGMGIVVLSLAILPFLGIGGQQLYNAEVPGFSSDQLTPRIASSAKILWGVYLLFSVLETILLYAGGMSLFDSWCTTCGTVATGGFSTRQDSIGAYDNAYFDIVITVFMFLAGANFLLHFKALCGRTLTYFRDSEFVFYLFLTVVAVLTVSFSIYGTQITTTNGKIVEGNFFNSLRYSSFQVVSIFTTTGFCTADFDKWPAYSKIILVSLMFIGGCGASTGGGMKNSRVLLLFKHAIFQIRYCLFPHAVPNIRLNNRRIDTATLHETLCFFFIFLMIFLSSSILVSVFCSTDILTAATASVASLGNVGPGLGGVGAMFTYAWMDPAAKLTLTIVMLLGRLEIYTVLVLLLPSFWRKY
ncbi:MAG: hypothetical protein A2017_19065 [Lentisphaerae bacterium GWF2_44_16]|nr:MAG: hypothetical protein A2017_19065 [Lentisphaerae bacterium GWF2_44_16]